MKKESEFDVMPHFSVAQDRLSGYNSLTKAQRKNFVSWCLRESLDILVMDYELDVIPQSLSLIYFPAFHSATGQSDPKLALVVIRRQDVG